MTGRRRLMTAEEMYGTPNYGALLADLQRRRAGMDAAIETLEQIIATEFDSETPTKPAEDPT